MVFKVKNDHRSKISKLSNWNGFHLNLEKELVPCQLCYSMGLKKLAPLFSKPNRNLLVIIPESKASVLQENQGH